jgi:hypothetical protein
MKDYSKGKIYKLVSAQNENVYIGSTIETLTRRYGLHKSKYTAYMTGKYHYVSSFELIKYNDCKIILIEEYPCENKVQLLLRERYYQELLPCINIKKAIYRDGEFKEHVKIYREENK